MKKEYKQLETYAGQTIENIVNKLLKYKENGELASCDFNGHELYSDTVTLNSAYMEITGRTKEEFDKAQEEWHKEYERQEREHKEKIPELSNFWIEEGKKVLNKDKWEYWGKIVPIRLGDLYHGMELEATLEIIKILNNNDFEKAKETFENQGHSGMSYGLVKNMIYNFSDKGNDFINYLESNI